MVILVHFITCQPVLQKENSEFKPVKLCLKTVFRSHPACAEGLDKCVWTKILNILKDNADFDCS